MKATIDQLRKNSKTEKHYEKDKMNLKFKNRYNEENPKRFKKQIQQKRKRDGYDDKKFTKQIFKKKKNTHNEEEERKGSYGYQTKRPLVMFNFRKNTLEND